MTKEHFKLGFWFSHWLEISFLAWGWPAAGRRKRARMVQEPWWALWLTGHSYSCHDRFETRRDVHVSGWEWWSDVRVQDAIGGREVSISCGFDGRHWSDASVQLQHAFDEWFEAGGWQVSSTRVFKKTGFQSSNHTPPVNWGNITLKMCENVSSCSFFHTLMIVKRSAAGSPFDWRSLLCRWLLPALGFLRHHVWAFGLEDSSYELPRKPRVWLGWGWFQWDPV